MSKSTKLVPTQEPTPPQPAAQNAPNTEDNLSAEAGTDTETPAALEDNLADAKPLSACTLIELMEVYIKSYRRIRDIQDEPVHVINKAYAFHEAVYDEIGAHFLANEEIKKSIADCDERIKAATEEDYLKLKAQKQLEALHSARAVQVEEETVEVLSDTRER
ncbi:hypothetical protein GVN20_24715 [Runella sp. CRIBMP]|uniref:hypothetical protein n=1 Tax=Runella sp. CRIBMP TaxID=2683261 RepID=UPI001412F14D|nr:hypothetical protein [Runella sp. CRIBMP]NBB22580.1 hypothetical protein [Runella sp. CRIBMP]